MRVSKVLYVAPCLGLALLLSTDADARRGLTLKGGPPGVNRTVRPKSTPSRPATAPSSRYYDITGDTDPRSPRFGVVGKRSVKHVPSPTVERTSMLPPIAFIS